MSNSLFVFAKSFDLEDSFASVLLNQQGDVTEAYAKRSINELQLLKKDAQLFWVLPSTLVTPKVVTLPTLKKSEQTIPFLLEETLVDDPSELHFALDKKPIDENQYLVYVCHREKLKQLVHHLAKHQLSVDIMTTDFIRAKKESLYLGSDYAIITGGLEAAAISYALLSHYQDNIHVNSSIYHFSDSPKHLKTSLARETIEEVPCSYPVYLAQHILSGSTINLLQGSLTPPRAKSNLLPTFAIGSLCLGLLAFLGNLTAQYMVSNSQLNELTQQTTAIYKQFFPNAQSVISPRFRIEQALKDNQNNSASERFFTLMSTLHSTFKIAQYAHVDYLKYGTDEITLRLHTKTFDQLDKLKLSIETQGVTVTQLSATSKGAYVSASWRLK